MDGATSRECPAGVGNAHDLTGGRLALPDDPFIPKVILKACTQAWALWREKPPSEFYLLASFPKTP